MDKLLSLGKLQIAPWGKLTVDSETVYLVRDEFVKTIQNIKEKSTDCVFMIKRNREKNCACLIPNNLKYTVIVDSKEVEKTHDLPSQCSIEVDKLKMYFSLLDTDEKIDRATKELQVTTDEEYIDVISFAEELTLN